MEEILEQLEQLYNKVVEQKKFYLVHKNATVFKNNVAPVLQERAKLMSSLPNGVEKRKSIQQWCLMYASCNIALSNFSSACKNMTFLARCVPEAKASAMIQLAKILQEHMLPLKTKPAQKRRYYFRAYVCYRYASLYGSLLPEQLELAKSCLLNSIQTNNEAGLKELFSKVATIQDLPKVLAQHFGQNINHWLESSYYFVLNNEFKLTESLGLVEAYNKSKKAPKENLLIMLKEFYHQLDREEATRQEIEPSSDDPSTRPQKRHKTVTL